MSVSTKQSAKTSHVKSTVLQKNGGRQRNLDPCSETLRTCLAEKCLRLLLSVPCGPFSWEDNTSASDCDCVCITHSCGQCSYTTLVRGAWRGQKQTNSMPSTGNNSIFSSGLNGHRELATQTCMNGAGVMK